MFVERLVRSRRRAAYIRVRIPAWPDLRTAGKALPGVVGACLIVVALSLAFTAWGYFLVSLGLLHPESMETAALGSPLLALFWVGMVSGVRAARRDSRTAWRAGLYPALGMVVIWFVVWCYLVGRFSPEDWWREGLLGLSGRHLIEWLLAVCCGVVGSIGGSLMGGRRWVGVTAGVCSLMVLSGVMLISSQKWRSSIRAADTMAMLCTMPETDGTVVRLFTFDFGLHPEWKVRLYDADADDRVPLDDVNSSYMGQGMDLVARKLDRRSARQERQLLCVFNAGFFGLHGSRLANHEAPIVIDGEPRYDQADQIRPEDQAWVFGVNSPLRVSEGAPRFRLVPEMSESERGGYDTVLAGVRPLRVEGRSLALEPGIGSTKLRCSRTSIGWTTSGDRFFVLIVRDPDTEGASNWQRLGGRPQTGGWDVREVQAFWEKLGIPDAVLLDGGESTQAAYRDARGGLVCLRGGYHIALPLGHWWGRPIMAFPAMLPRLQNYRGVLNYLYVDRERL